MQKGASNADSKKSAPPDDDFGKDFFESWKPAKLGNNSMNFDMETVPKTKNTSFKFDELDNFELSGNFDKLSSFKLDVPDLDFSGLSKKKEMTLEKSSKEIVTGKKESKEDKFSFDFDFNSFDLDSKSLEDKGASNFSDKSVPDHSSKHEKKQESSDNMSASTTNISGDQPSDFAHKTEITFGKRAAIAEDSEKQACVTMARREHSLGKYLEKKKSDNNQDCCLQSFSGDGSTEVALPGIQTNNAPLDVIKPRTTMEKHDSMQPISSSPSRSSSPVDSYISGWKNSSVKELSNSGSELQKHQSGDPLTRTSGSLTGSIQIRKVVYNSTGPRISIEGVKNIDEKHNSCQNPILPLPPQKQNSHKNLMLPPLKSDITFGGSTKLRGIMSTGLQLKTISKLEDIPQQSAAFKSKSFNSMMETRTKTTHASTTNESSLQFKTSSAAQQTSVGAKNMAEPKLEKPITDATVEPRMSSADNNTGSVKEGAIAKFVSSTRLGSQIINTNNKGVTLGDNNHRGILDSAIAKTIEVNNNKQNSAKPREAKSVRFLEKRMECPLIATSKTANPANIEKQFSLHAPLKRKIDEQSVADLETSSPLKCVKESNANRRISFEASPNTKMKMVPEIKITETCKDVTPVANQTSLTAVPEMGNPVYGASSFFEDNHNLQKAETITKELDNICNTLKKKHNEAKELQVRSIINNNALLLLNYPMLEEKIQALQKFTSGLLLMEI